MLVESNLLLVSCLLFASCCYALSSDSNPPPTPLAANSAKGSNPTPIEQALVPEGVFAAQLVSVLNLGTATDQGNAETLLSNLGIEPKNGWISEYPVTPAELGEIDHDITLACEKGLIKLPKNQALKLVSDLKAKLGLDINTNPTTNPLPAINQNQKPVISKIYSYTDSKGMKNYTDNFDAIPAQYQAQAKVISQTALPTIAAGSQGLVPNSKIPANTAATNPDLINSYYQNQGPPVVTYYPPPTPYYYLYSWVSYPFWSTGYYFPGYYVLNDFHRHVEYNHQPYHISHHAGPGNTANGLNNNNWYGNGNAQAGARSIVSLEQNRHMQPGLNQNIQSQGNPAMMANAQHERMEALHQAEHQRRESFQQNEARFHNQIPNQQQYYQPNNVGVEDHRILNSPQVYGEPMHQEFHQEFREGGGMHAGGNFGGHHEGGGGGGRR
jgi:hypothetical protein